MSGTGLSVICGAEPDVVGVWGFFSSFFPFSTDSCLVIFMEQRENINTKRKMNYAAKTFIQFLSNVKTEFRQINDTTK
jgi:hypothetical protein